MADQQRNRELEDIQEVNLKRNLPQISSFPIDCILIASDSDDTSISSSSSEDTNPPEILEAKKALSEYEQEYERLNIELQQLFMRYNTNILSRSNSASLEDSEQENGPASQRFQIYVVGHKINMIKRIYDRNNEEISRCALCKVVFADKKRVIEFPCNHIFHLWCASKWLRKQDQCPTCGWNCIQQEKQSNIMNDGTQP